MTSHSFIRKDIFFIFLLLLIMMGPFLGPLLKGKSITLSSFLFIDSLYYTSRPDDYADAVKLPDYLDLSPVLMNYPFDIHSARTFREGHFPLWNPFIAAGTPLLGNFPSSPFSPLKIILVMFPLMRAYDFYLLSRLLVALWGAYILARYLKRSPQSSFLASVTYGFSGYILLHFQMLEVTSCCFAPIQFLAAESWARRQDLRSCVLLGAATTLMILSGHPEPSVLIIIGSFIYGVVRAFSLRREWKRVFTNGIVAGILGLLLAAFMLFPFLEFLQYGLTYKTLIHEPPPPFIYRFYHLLSLLAPLTQTTTPYIHGTGTYVGIASLGLAILAIIMPGRRWELIAVLLIPLGMAFAIPPLSLVWRIPHFDYLWSDYSLPLFTLCMALLAGEGVDSLTSHPHESRRGQVLFYIGISFLVGLFLHSLLISSKAGPGFFPALPLVLSALSGRFFLALVIMAFSLAAWRLKSPVLVEITKWGLPAIACMDLLLSGWNYTLARPQFDFPETPSIRFLKTHMGYSRIIGLYKINNIPNTGMVHGLTDIRSFNPIHIRRYLGFMWKADPTMISMTFLTNQPVSPLWDLMGVKFVLQSKVPTRLRYNKYKEDFQGETPESSPEKIRAPSLKPVYSDEGLTIYENLRALPRAFIVHKAFFVKGEEESLEALDRIIDGGLDPRKTAIIEVSDEVKREEIEKKLGRQADGEAAVIESYRPDVVEISAAMKAPGFLVLTDAFYPGWIAEVDGKRAEILPAYHLVRAIFLNEGQHRVIFRYRPMSFRIGILLSGMTLIGICVAFIVKGRYGKKEKRARR